MELIKQKQQKFGDNQTQTNNLTIYWSYFVFLFKVITRHFTNWLIFGVYLFLLLLILVIIPAALDASPATYWNNPFIQVSSFIMPIAAIFASCISVDLFRDGIDTGIELIIISKPVSRINYVLAKFSLLFTVLLFYGLSASLIGLLTYAVPKMDHAAVGDLIAGLFTGTFINGLFLGSFAILFSMRLGKNSTNMIIILLTLIFNFLTPLSMLFFEPPAKALNNEGVNLFQQSVQKKTHDKNNTQVGSDIIFQIPTTFGETKYVDVKTEYEKADSNSFYTKSFYLNIGNMINSLYNLGSLAPYHRAFIALTPNNTSWQFGESLDREIDPKNPQDDKYTRLILGSSLESGILPTQAINPFEKQVVLLPMPAPESWSLFNSLFGLPSYRFLTNEQTNETERKNATAELYTREENKIDSALTNSFKAFSELLNTQPNEQQSFQKQIAESFNHTTSDIEILAAKLSGIFMQMMSKQNMNFFEKKFEENYVADDNETSAKNIFSAKVSLFYGLDEFARTDEINTYKQFTETFLKNDFLNQVTNQILAGSLTNDNMSIEDLRAVLPVYPALRTFMPMKSKDTKVFTAEQILSATILSYLYTNFTGIYLVNVGSSQPTTGQQQEMVKYRTSLGAYTLKENQIKNSYVVTTVPVIDPGIIVLIMIIISFSFFIGISFLYYYQDIA